MGNLTTKFLLSSSKWKFMHPAKLINDMIKFDDVQVAFRPTWHWIYCPIRLLFAQGNRYYIVTPSWQVGESAGINNNNSTQPEIV